jgi:hypothetical protein
MADVSTNTYNLPPPPRGYECWHVCGLPLGRIAAEAGGCALFGQAAPGVGGAQAGHGRVDGHHGACVCLGAPAYQDLKCVSGTLSIPPVNNTVFFSPRQHQQCARPRRLAGRHHVLPPLPLPTCTHRGDPTVAVKGKGWLFRPGVGVSIG